MLRVGVIGLGAMGRHHARIYSELPNAKLVGVADLNDELTATTARKYKTKGFGDFHDLLQQKLDAVSIAVPTSLHRDVAIAAAGKGVNVLVEKPIADTIQNAEDMIKSCQQSGVKLMVGHIERFNPIVPVIKKAIEGFHVISITIARLGPFPPRIRDVGIVIDLATHDIDLVRYLTTSEAKKVYSLVKRKSLSEHEDSALISFETESGVLVQLTVNWLTPFKVREINIATREKFVRGWFQEQKVWEYQRWKEDNSYIVKEFSVPFAEPLKLELEAFLTSIENNTGAPIPGEEGLKTLAVALECLKGTR